MSGTREDVFRALLEAHIYAEMSLGPDPTQSSDLANDVRRDWLDRWEKAEPNETDGSMVSAARGIEDGPEPEPTSPRSGITTRAAPSEDE